MEVFLLTLQTKSIQIQNRRKKHSTSQIPNSPIQQPRTKKEMPATMSMMKMEIFFLQPMPWEMSQHSHTMTEARLPKKPMP